MAAQPVLTDLRAAGDTVHCIVRETNAFTELLGLDPYVLDLTFVVRDGPAGPGSRRARRRAARA